METRGFRVFTHSAGSCVRNCAIRRIDFIELGPNGWEGERKGATDGAAKEMIPPWIWEGHCPLVINIYKTRMPSETLLTEEKKKAEYIGRQLRISLFAAVWDPHPAFGARNGNVCVAWLQLFSLLQFLMDRLDFSGLSLRTFLILSSYFILLCLWKELLHLCTTFHIVQSLQYKWLTNRYSTNKIIFIVLCIWLLISSNIFRLNCHHQEADTILLKLAATK